MPKGLIKSVIKLFWLKGADKSVKKRLDPKMGTIGEVRPLNTLQKWEIILLTIKKNSNKMFKFKSYNVKKASEKNEKQQPSSSTKTLKKLNKEKTKPSAEEIKAVNNKSSPKYAKKNTTAAADWHKNKTYSAKNETKKVVIPTPHKKLERK